MTAIAQIVVEGAHDDDVVEVWDATTNQRLDASHKNHADGCRRFTVAADTECTVLLSRQGLHRFMAACTPKANAQTFVCMHRIWDATLKYHVPGPLSFVDAVQHSVPIDSIPPPLQRSYCDWILSPPKYMTILQWLNVVDVEAGDFVSLFEHDRLVMTATAKHDVVVFRVKPMTYHRIQVARLGLITMEREITTVQPSENGKTFQHVVPMLRVWDPELGVQVPGPLSYERLDGSGQACPNWAKDDYAEWSRQAQDEDMGDCTIFPTNEPVQRPKCPPRPIRTYEWTKDEDGKLVRVVDQSADPLHWSQTIFECSTVSVEQLRELAKDLPITWESYRAVIQLERPTVATDRTVTVVDQTGRQLGYLATKADGSVIEIRSLATALPRLW